MTEQVRDYSEHDLLITLVTKVDMIIEKMANIPEDCITHCQEIKTINERINIINDATTWAGRYAITALVGLVLFLGGLLIKEYAPRHINNTPNNSSISQQER